MTESVKGVATVTPPGWLIPSIERNVEAVLSNHPDFQGAIIQIHTDAGINFVVTKKFHESWKIVGFIGKKWGERVEAGGEILWYF